MPAPLTPTSAASTPRASQLPQPLPCSSVPANDATCLPTGFSPVPAAAAASGQALAEALDSPMTSPARKVIDTATDTAATTPRASALPPAADRATPQNTPQKLATAAAAPAGLNLKRLPLPDGLQCMSLNDITILHCWLRGRLGLACGHFDEALRWFAALDTPTKSSVAQRQVQQLSLLMSDGADAAVADVSSSDGPSQGASVVDLAALAAHATPAADAAVAAVGGALPALCSDAEVRLQICLSVWSSVGTTSLMHLFMYGLS